MISKPENFRNETIAVFVKWAVEVNYDTINPSVSPQVTINESNGTSALLILSYNTLYDVSVAATLCGQSLSSPVTELFYGESLHHSKYLSLLLRLSNVGKCNPPLTEENERYVIANYSNYPAIVGTSVTFACKDPGLLFNGSNSSMCMGNGEWEPDPMKLKCTPKGNVTRFVLVCRGFATTW